MSNLVHNERTKMIATHFNNLAVASVVTGIIVPGFQGASILDGWKWVGPVLLGMFLQGVFLFLANWTLRTLEE